MNQIAIGINLNNRPFLIAVQWPIRRRRSLKEMARLKLAQLRRKVSDALNKVAMAIIPLPQAAAA